MIWVLHYLQADIRIIFSFFLGSVFKLGIGKSITRQSGELYKIWLQFSCGCRWFLEPLTFDGCFFASCNFFSCVFYFFIIRCFLRFWIVWYYFQCDGILFAEGNSDFIELDAVTWKNRIWYFLERVEMIEMLCYYFLCYLAVVDVELLVLWEKHGCRRVFVIKIYICFFFISRKNLKTNYFFECEFCCLFMKKWTLAYLALQSFYVWVTVPFRWF